MLCTGLISIQLKKNTTQAKVEKISRFSPVGPGGLVSSGGKATLGAYVMSWEAGVNRDS